MSLSARLRTVCLIALLFARWVASAPAAPRFGLQAIPVNLSAGYYMTADLNGDGLLDVVTVDGSSLHVLLGDGVSPYQVSSFRVGWYVNAYDAADVTGDGVPDILVVGRPGGPWTLSVLEGNGDGTFTPLSEVSLPYRVYWVHARDLDLDGWGDVVVTHEGGIGVLRGLGNGVFSPVEDVLLESMPWMVASADLDLDGWPDLLLPMGLSEQLIVLPGRADGGFDLPRSWATTGRPFFVDVADFDADGHTDVAMLLNDDSLLVGLGAGDGTFVEAARLAFDAPIGPPEVGDLDGDGNEDIVAFLEDTRLVMVPGRGDGTFGSPVTWAGVYKLASWTAPC